MRRTGVVELREVEAGARLLHGVSELRPSALTAVLLDRHPMWLDSLEQVLQHTGIRSLARETAPEAALAQLAAHEPRLFVLDIDVDGSVEDGLACLREACACVPSLNAVVFSACEDPATIDAALAAGAAAYVLKRAQRDDLTSAIRQAFERSVYLPRRRGSARSKGSAAARAELTRRELEILTSVAEGRTNREVAKLLWVTEQTVKFHLANIFRKLAVSNRTQASRWAHEHGVLMDPAEALSAGRR